MSDVRPCRVLVVEDEPLVALSLERLLEAEGCAVVGPAASVASALALLDSSSIDGAILDVNLRGEEVYPVADRLAASSTPYVFVTGHSAEVLPQAHRTASVVTKPYSDSEIMSVVKTFIREIV